MNQMKGLGPIIQKLNSNGPNEKYKDKLMLFGQFVGDWEIVECNAIQEDGSIITTKGELHWGWILNGRAVQDIWIGAPDMGTTVRFYDPEIDAWHSVWMTPTQGVVRNFIGRKVEDEIVLETRDTNNKLIHWIFYDISPETFRWRAEESTNDGETWIKTEEMFIRRIQIEPTRE